MASQSIQRIAQAAAILVVCCLAIVVLARYAALPSDTVFILVTIPILLAVWFAYRNWRSLFGGVAERFRWSPRTVGFIALLILIVGVVLRLYLGRSRGTVALDICFFAAMGCSAMTRRLRDRK